MWKAGDRVLLRYEGQPLRHEQLVIGEAYGGNWATVTPDIDIYKGPLHVCVDVAEVVAMPGL